MKQLGFTVCIQVLRNETRRADYCRHATHDDWVQAQDDTAKREGEAERAGVTAMAVAELRDVEAWWLSGPGNRGSLNREEAKSCTMVLHQRLGSYVTVDTQDFNPEDPQFEWLKGLQRVKRH